MSVEPRPSSHAATWTLVTLAVPLLYVIGMPPLVFFSLRVGLWDLQPEPKWIESVIAPYEWLQNRTPLKKPLDAYASWCARTFGPRNLFRP